MVDFYLEHPEELRGQPKRAIADYVEQNGILVPRRFDSFDKARKSGLVIIARSEHPQDYDGASGLVNSYILDSRFWDFKSEEEIKNRALKKYPNRKTRLERYYKLMGIENSQFENYLSYSYWEKIPGFNRAVITDSSIRNRYHILTTGKLDKEYYANYSIVEKGTIISNFINPLTNQLELGLEALIDFYERIRNLNRFNSKHCPVIEIQTFNDKNYFLQYHKTRDFEKAKFVLERKPVESEYHTLFVRGATIPEGIECKATLVYAAERNGKWKIKDEEASFDLHHAEAFSEIMTRKRQLQIISSTKPLEDQFYDFECGHLQRSKLFKPKVSILLDTEKLFSEEEQKKLISKAEESDEDQYVNVHIVSDGRKAYIKRI